MPTPTFTTGMDYIHHDSISISPPPQTVHWCTIQPNGKLSSAPKTNHIAIERWVEAPTTWTIDRDLYPFPVVIVESSVQLNELKMIIFVNTDTIQIPIKYMQIALPNNKTAYIITHSKVRLPKPQMVSVAIETSCGFWSNSIQFVTTTKPPTLPFNAGISNSSVSLFQAAIEGRIIRVKECVDRGICNVNAKDEDGRPALVYAALYNQIPVVEYLLLNRAEVDSVDEYDGETALHKAAFLKHVEICHLLLIYGASTLKQNAEGVTPQDFATRVGLDLEALSRVSCLVSPGHITPCKNSIILIRSRLLHKLDGVPTVKFGEATGNVLRSSPSAIEVMCPAMETLGKITVTILSSTQGLQFDMVIDEAQVAPFSEIHSVCMLPSYSFEEKKVASLDLFDLDNFPMEDECIIPEPMHGRERAMATTDMGTFVYPRKLSSPVSLGELPHLMSSSPEKTPSPLRRNSSASHSQYQQLMVQQKLLHQMMALNNPSPPEPHPHQAKVCRTQSLPADQFHAAMEGQFSRSLDDTLIQSAIPPLPSRGRSLEGSEYANLVNLNNNEVKKPRLERGRSMSDVHNRKKSIGKGRIRTGSFSSGSPIPSPPRKLSDPYPCTFHLFEQPSPTQRKSYPREPRYFSPNPVTVLASCPYTIDSGWVTVRAVHATDLNDFSQNVLGEAEITQPLDEGKKAQFSLRCVETTKKQYVRLKFIVHYVSNQLQCEEIIYSDAFVISSHPKKKNEQAPM